MAASEPEDESRRGHAARPRLDQVLAGVWGTATSVLPLNGQSFDLNPANGKLMRMMIAAL
jgi:hypothetical protein